jgi:putative molybdopterin biosynthesis protein
MGRRTGAGDLENRIRELRQAAGLSQSELAKKVGITRQAVSAIESGSYVPNTAVALQIGRALGSPVEDLFTIGDISLKIRARAGAETGSWDRQPRVTDESGNPLDSSARVQLSRVGDELIATELAGTDRFLAADGVARFDGDAPGELDVDLLVEPDLPERTILILGCDPSLGLLAEHVHRATRDTRVLWRHAGSISALRALKAGEAHIAGTHLWDPETGESNLPIIRKELVGMPVAVIALSQWQQGLMVQSGNPKGIRSVSDLARSDVSIVNRESGSGSRVLLDHHLDGSGLQAESVAGYERLRRSHADIAAAIRDGLADAGPGILASARAAGLDFIPLQEERYDLVVPLPFLEYRPVRALLETATARGYRREIETLGGYDSSVTGTTIAEIA